MPLHLPSKPVWRLGFQGLQRTFGQPASRRVCRVLSTMPGSDSDDRATKLDPGFTTRDVVVELYHSTWVQLWDRQAINERQGQGAPSSASPLASMTGVGDVVWAIRRTERGSRTWRRLLMRPLLQATESLLQFLAAITLMDARALLASCMPRWWLQERRAIVFPSRFPEQRRPDCRETMRLLGDSRIHQSTETQPIRTDVDPDNANLRWGLLLPITSRSLSAMSERDESDSSLIASET
eukprot:3940144-Rhodomonas_salina.1